MDPRLDLGDFRQDQADRPEFLEGQGVSAARHFEASLE
jgi:hypothetical protein